MVPLLLRGLELPDFTIRANVIDTLASAAEGDAPDESLIADHSSSLVATMLKNSLASQTPSVVIMSPVTQGMLFNRNITARASLCSAVFGHASCNRSARPVTKT